MKLVLFVDGSGDCAGDCTPVSLDFGRALLGGGGFASLTESASKL